MKKAIDRAERVRKSIVPSREVTADRLEVVARLREMASRSDDYAADARACELLHAAADRLEREIRAASEAGGDG